MTVPTLPNFTADGVLPPGDYAMTLDELEDSILVLGPGQPRDHPVWDAAWRRADGTPKGIIKILS
jgi:hypothetical protein